LTDKKTDLHVLPTETDKLLASLHAMKRALPLFIEIAPEIARARRASYDAHVEAGFTSEEALALCQRFTP
jgi:hypothetical protein